VKNKVEKASFSPCLFRPEYSGRNEKIMAVMKKITTKNIPTAMKKIQECGLHSQKLIPGIKVKRESVDLC
jgi:hypothetical protein